MSLRYSLIRMIETSLGTRDRVLDAAERLFAELGFAGTSVRRITSEAGADLGSVRYHFGSKAKLYRGVLERRLVPLCERRLSLLAEAQSGGGSAEERVERIVRAFVAPAFLVST